MFQEIIYDLLFGVRVQSSNIEGDQFELLPVKSHIGELSVDMSSVSVGECISPAFSVTGSTPTLSLHFVLGFLALSVIGSTPTIRLVFVLELLALLQWWLTDLLFFLFGCLAYRWKRCRSALFRSPSLIFWQLFGSLLPVALVDSFSVGVNLLASHFLFPVDMFPGVGALVDGLVRLSILFLFLFCPIFHVHISVVVVLLDIVGFLRHLGSMGRVSFIIFGTYTFSLLLRDFINSRHFPQVSVRLHLFLFAGERYWGQYQLSHAI